MNAKLSLGNHASLPKAAKRAVSLLVWDGGGGPTARRSIPLLLLSLAVSPVHSEFAWGAEAAPHGPAVHIAALQEIADANGGNRASGTPGFDRSAEYVAETLERPGYQVRVEEFTFPYFKEHSPPVLAAVPLQGPVEPVHAGQIRTLTNSGSGDLTAPLEAIDFEIPPGGATLPSTSGCEKEDFTTFSRGSVALLRRGTCPFQVKVDNSAAAGAVGAVVVNTDQGNRTEAFRGQLQSPASIPVVGVSSDLGLHLASTAASSKAAVRLAVHTEAGMQASRNVIGEAKSPAEQMVVVGAHLDSVDDGPGINDNATGTAAVLEAALRLARAPGGPSPGIRFAFWGAEEKGLWGSRHHLARLPEEERRRIALYINLDMVGSLNFVRFVEGAAHPPESLAGTVRNALLAFFRERQLHVEERTSQPAGYGSDGMSFERAEIPTIGLHTGSGEVKSPAQAGLSGGQSGQPFDPCYHQACDTAANVEIAVLEQMSERWCIASRF